MADWENSGMLMRLTAWVGLVLISIPFVSLATGVAKFPDILTWRGPVQEPGWNEVPSIEQELLQARKLLDQMLPEIEQKIRIVAREEVEVAAQRTQVKRNELQLSQSRKALVSMREVFQSPPSASDSQPKGTREQQRLKLAFQRYKADEEILKSQRELLSMREEALHTVLCSLEQQQAYQEILEQRIDTLASQHEVLELRSFQESIDRSSLRSSLVDSQLTDVEQRVEVASRLLEQSDLREDLVVFDEEELKRNIERHFFGVDQENQQPAPSRPKWKRD